MTPERLRETLEGRAPGQWELYRKSADSRELARTGAGRVETWRREEGWAARWWEDGFPRFAGASAADLLERAITEAPRLPAGRQPPPPWPEGRHGDGGGAVSTPDLAPDLFDDLHRLLSAESRGDAVLSRVTVRRGAAAERIWNGRGLDVALATAVFDGHAVAVGRKSPRACEARVLFRWEDGPDIVSLARRLCDRATLPLSGRATPIARSPAAARSTTSSSSA